MLSVWDCLSHTSRLVNVLPLNCSGLPSPGGDFTENQTLQALVRVAGFRPSGSNRIRKQKPTSEEYSLRS
jgi:hypothetical protein